jgi:hypothetical protein
LSTLPDLTVFGLSDVFFCASYFKYRWIACFCAVFWVAGSTSISILCLAVSVELSFPACACVVRPSVPEQVSPFLVEGFWGGTEEAIFVSCAWSPSILILCCLVALVFFVRPVKGFGLSNISSAVRRLFLLKEFFVFVCLRFSVATHCLIFFYWYLLLRNILLF